MSRKDDLNAYTDLINDLQETAPRPSPLPPPFKSDLRQRLLGQYTGTRAWWPAIGQGLRTAVALSVLAFIVIFAWGVMSRPATPGGTTVTSPTPLAAADASEQPEQPDMVNQSADRLAIDLGGELAVSTYEIVEGDQSLSLTLFWQVLERPSANYHLFFHLRDATGATAAQLDQPLQSETRPPSTWTTGETVQTTHVLPLPASLPAARYDLIIGLYDPLTGVRLPVTTNDPHQNAENGTAVWLTDKFVEYKNTARVWLIAATQHARSSATAPLLLEITVGYEFDAGDGVTLRPLYANPDWMTVSEGRSPIDSLGDAVDLGDNAGVYTFTVSSDPAMMRQIVGVEQAILVMQLAQLVEHADGRRELQTLAMPTLTEFVIDFTITEEITFTAPETTAP